MLKCGWCGSAGTVIGNAKSFPGTKIVKCDVCHHEWEISGVATPQQAKRWRQLIRSVVDKLKGST